MRLFDHILVAVGDIERDGELLQYARNLRTLYPAAVFQFVHVLGWNGPNRQEPLTHGQARTALEKAVQTHFGGDGAICHVLHGSRVDRLLETAAESVADVILVGHTREQSGRRALARRLAMKAPCSVWMRPEGSSMSVRRILAAIDYSDHAAHALSVAAQIARLTGTGECLAVHVDQEGVRTTGWEGAANRHNTQREIFARFAAPLDTGGVAVRSLIEESSNVAHAVERVVAASGIDLVVMGSRGQTRSAGILLGSESENVLMESTAPVLITKSRGDRIGVLQALLDRNFHLQDPPRFG